MAEETPQLFNLTPDTLLTAVANGIPVTVRLGDMAEYLGTTAPAPTPPPPAPNPTQQSSMLAGGQSIIAASNAAQPTGVA